MMTMTPRYVGPIWSWVVVLLAIMLLALPATASLMLTEVASGLNSPTDIQNANDDSGRLFFVQQTGQIMVWQNEVIRPTPFLNIAHLIVSGGERGLLGLAFHPDYRHNGLFYVNYTRQADGATVVARYARSSADPDVANPQSAQILLTITQPFANHNGGAMQFGPDGYLYIATGDGGSANDPQNNAQNLTSLLGKLLRINVNSTTGQLPYGIPHDNPFVGSVPSGARPEIWAYGLRNPWRISFDRMTGDLFIADVGQNKREEINFVRAGTAGGLNFGWRVMEGTICTNLAGDPPCNPAGFTPPLIDYDHSQGCSVTGGYLYRGDAVHELKPLSPAVAGQLFNGLYIYGDFCSGTIWGVRATAAGGIENKVILSSALRITTFGEDDNGELYVADAAIGKIYKFISTVAISPSVFLLLDKVQGLSGV